MMKKSVFLAALLFIAAVSFSITLMPTVGDMENNISQGTSSGTFSTIASANITPFSANKTYFAVVTFSMFNPTKFDGVGEWRLVADGVTIGSIQRTIVANSLNDSAFLSAPFTSNGTNNVSIQLQHRKVSGVGAMSFNTTFSDTNIFGMRDTTSGSNLSFFNFSYNVTSSNPALVPIANFSMNFTGGQPVIFIGSQTTTTSTGLVMTEANLTASDGTVYPCNLSLKRTRTAGTQGGSVISCIIPAYVAPGVGNLTLFATAPPAGSANYFGQVNAYEFFNDSKTTENNQTTVSGITVASQTLTLVKNLSIEVVMYQMNILSLATLSVNSTTAGSTAWFQIRALNSTSGLPAPSLQNVSEVENLSFSVANSDEIMTIQHAITLLPPGNYTVQLWANSTADVNFDGGLLTGASADNSNITQVTTANVSITYPVSLTGSPTQFLFQNGSCSFLTTVLESDDAVPGTTRWVYCSLYFNNGNGAWALYGNQSTNSSGSTTFNWTNVTDSGQFSANCSAVVDGIQAYSQTEFIDVQGTSFCVSQPANNGIWIWVAMIAAVFMLGYGRLIRWEGVGLAVLFILAGATAFLTDTAGDLALPELANVVSAYFIFTILLLAGGILYVGFGYFMETVGKLRGKA